MRVSDKAIVLQSIRHGDKKFILKLYSKQHGLLTTIASVRNSSKSKIKPSAILPLTLVDIELITKQNKDIQVLTEMSCYKVLTTINNSFSKLSIAQFLNEILIKSLKEQSGNEHLFSFIESCLILLNDLESNFTNLHLYFLIELTKYLGFEPQNNYSTQTPFFDCRAGCFSSAYLIAPFGLNHNDSKHFSEFLKSNALLISITNTQRQMLLNVLVDYYKLHLPEFNDVKSLEVLREIAGT
jgi:DNA repair protein RecO (recombination protein O)